MGAPKPNRTGHFSTGFLSIFRPALTQRQRCWVHQERNVLSKLPQWLLGKAKEQFHQIMYAPDRESPRVEIGQFREEFGEKYAKAVDCLAEDQAELLTFMQFPAVHWVHLRTTNPIEIV